MSNIDPVAALQNAQKEVAEAQDAVKAVEAIMQQSSAEPVQGEGPPSVENIMTDVAEPPACAFEYGHMSAHMQGIVGPFFDLAKNVLARYPAGADRAWCLVKLSEAADYAVRAGGK